MVQNYFKNIMSIDSGVNKLAHKRFRVIFEIKNGSEGLSLFLYFTALHNFYDAGAIMDIEIPVDLEKPVVIWDLHCTGNENSIWDCPHNILPQNLSFGDQNAAVLCQGDDLWTNYLV